MSERVVGRVRGVEGHGRLNVLTSRMLEACGPPEDQATERVVRIERLKPLREESLPP